MREQLNDSAGDGQMASPPGGRAPARSSYRPGIGSRSRAGSAIFSAAVWQQISLNLQLSIRELQIILGTFNDQTETTIAANLRISRSTVHTYVERLHHKLGVADRAQLILRVVQEFMALPKPPRCCLPQSPPSTLTCNR